MLGEPASQLRLSYWNDSPRRCFATQLEELTLHGHCPKSCRIQAQGRTAAPLRRGIVVYLAPAALTAWHCAHRSIPARAPDLELRGSQRTRGLRCAGEVSQFPAPGASSGVDLYFYPDHLSRRVRSLHLAARQVERGVLPIR